MHQLAMRFCLAWLLCSALQCTTADNGVARPDGRSDVASDSVLGDALDAQVVAPDRGTADRSVSDRFADEQRSDLGQDIEADDADEVEWVSDLTDPMIDETDATDICEQAAARLDHPVCTLAVPDETVFWNYSGIEPSYPDALRRIKFSTPAVAATPLPTVFQHMGFFVLHVDFIRQAFPQWYGSLTDEQYMDLFLRRATRQYFSGVIFLVDNRPATGYVFGVHTGSDAPDELLTPTEIAQIQDQLVATFSLQPLSYTPLSAGQARQAAEWTETGLTVYFGSWAPHP